MGLALQLFGAALGTGVLFFGCGPLLARVLRLKGGPDGVQAQLAAMAVRLLLAALLALAFALSGLEHRAALVFSVGAAYFAAAMVDGMRKFRRRNAAGGAQGGAAGRVDDGTRRSPQGAGDGRELDR